MTKPFGKYTTNDLHMMKPLDQYTTEELQKEIEKRNAFNYDETQDFLEEKGIAQHQGKGVTVWADDLLILLEAIHGDKDAVERHKTINTIHFEENASVSLLDSATANVKEVLDLLQDGDVRNLTSFEENYETVYAVTLADIGHTADYMEREEPDVIAEFHNLTFEDKARVFTKILGEPLGKIRENPDPATACGIRTAIMTYINDTIRTSIQDIKKETP